MSDILTLLVAAYTMTVGFAIVTGGFRNLSRVNGWWIKTIRQFVGWALDLVGDMFKGAAGVTRGQKKKK